MFDVALDGHGRLAPTAVEQCDSRAYTLTRRAEGIDKGSECGWRVFTGERLDAFWPGLKVVLERGKPELFLL